MTDMARSRNTAEAQSGWRVGQVVRLRRFLPTFDPFERVFYAGLVLAAIGFGQVAPWLAFAIPGSALSIVALILKLRRP